MTRFSRIGILEPDSNLVERCMRPVAVGRKAWLYAGLLPFNWKPPVAFETLSARQELRRFVDDPRAIGLREVRDIGPGRWNIRCDARLPEHLESPQRDAAPKP